MKKYSASKKMYIFIFFLLKKEKSTRTKYRGRRKRDEHTREQFKEHLWKNHNLKRPKEQTHDQT